MSFWTGMANATKDRADRNERQDARDQDQAYRDKMFDYAQSQDLLAAKRLTEQDALRAEDLLYNRTAQEAALELTASNRTLDLQVRILEANPDLAVSLGGGGTPTTGSGGRTGNSGNSYVPGSREQADSVDYLIQQLGGAEGVKNLKGESKVLFDGALNDPATAYTLHMFQQAQLKAGNNIAIEDLPSYFKIASSVTAKGGDAMEAFYESGGLEGVTDNESFLRGFAALAGYEPARLNLNQIAPVTSEDDQMKTANMVREFDNTKTAELVAARMSELTSSGVTTGGLFEIYQKISNSNPAIVAVGKAQLASDYPELVFRGGINGGVGSASKTDNVVAEGVGSPDLNINAPLPTFDTTAKANLFAKRNPEYSGEVNVNGKVFTMGVYVAPASVEELKVEEPAVRDPDTQPQSDAGKVAQQNLDNASTMSTAMSEITEEEYEDLTRIQRRELGLPESSMDLMFAKQEGGSFGVTPEEKAETDALREMLQNTPAPEGMGESFPNENTGIQDKSLTDSQALYDILESGMSQDVIDEAIIAFEKDYGAGSARAAYEMITSRQ